MTRDQKRALSNNAENPNKNLCVLAVAAALGCGECTRYLHTIRDLVYCLRKYWTVRSRGARTVGKTVGAVRHLLPRLAAEVGATAFVVRVRTTPTQGHVLLLDPDGRTIVDTAPKKSDRRRITDLYVVY